MLYKYLYLLEKVFFWPSRIVMGVAIFLRHLRLGLHYGYPLCCILQFSISRALGIHKLQGLRRGGVRLGPTKVYVPCSYHKGRHPNWRPHKQWLAESIVIKDEYVTGQNSLNNFYQSVKFTNPRLAVLMTDDIIQVALGGLAADKTDGQAAADRLRQIALEHNLPEVHRRVLENALTGLGYS